MLYRDGTPTQLQFGYFINSGPKVGAHTIGPAYTKKLGYYTCAVGLQLSVGYDKLLACVISKTYDILYIAPANTGSMQDYSSCAVSIYRAQEYESRVCDSIWCARHAKMKVAIKKTKF